MDWRALTAEQRDRLVAEKVMNWQPKRCCDEYPVTIDTIAGLLTCHWCGWQDGIETFNPVHELPEQPIPAYTTDMNAAWQIVEKMVQRMYNTIGFEWDGPTFKPEHHYLTAEGYPLGSTCWYVRVATGGRRHLICADTPQEVICLAALKAVGVEVNLL